MPSPPTHTNAALEARRHRRRVESAFSMVEVLVVLVIIGVLIATLAGVGSSSSRATSTQAALSVSRTYADAVELFADEHGGRAPVPGSADWPDRLPPSQVDRTPANLQRHAAGPVNVAAGSRPYLPKVPEPIVTKSLPFAAGGSAATPPSIGTDSLNRISYHAGSGTQWRIDVERRRTTGSAWTTSCWLGPGPGSGGPRC